ncbi:MAG: hypothetical protein ABIK28_00650, partial [Planctomycetota bacterium]
KEGVFANITDLSALKDESIRAEHAAGLLGGMLVLYLLAAVGTQWFRKISGDPALQRRRAAKSNAQERLKQGVAKIRSGTGILEGSDLIHSAFAGLVADVGNLPKAGLTLKDVTEQLTAFGVDASTANRVAKILELCDGARYGALNTLETPSLIEESNMAMKTVLDALRKQGRLR